MQTKHLIGNIIAIVLVVILIVSFNFSPANIALTAKADTQSDYDKVNDELEKLRANQSKLDSEFSNLNAKLNEAGQKVSELEIQISEKQTAIENATKDIEDMEVQIEDQYATMKLRIQFMYENGTESLLSSLLLAEDFSDLLSRAEYIRKLTDYDHDKMSDLNNLLTNQKEVKAQLESDYKELLALKDEAEKESATLSSLMSQAKNNIDTNSKSIADAEALALQYEKKIQEELLAKQMKEIASNSDNGVDPNALAQVLANYTAEDVAMLAALIECEAGNQPYEGRLAVASVVINRVASPRFADSIEGVIYAPYQFSPAGSGRLAIVMARGACDTCTQAAIEVLNGHININAYYFHGYNPAVDTGGTVIGDHVFY